MGNTVNECQSPALPLSVSDYPQRKILSALTSNHRSSVCRTYHCAHSLATEVVQSMVATHTRPAHKKTRTEPLRCPRTAPFAVEQDRRMCTLTVSTGVLARRSTLVAHNRTKKNENIDRSTLLYTVIFPACNCLHWLARTSRASQNRTVAK